MMSQQALKGWRSVSGRRRFIQIVAAAMGEMRGPDVGFNGSDRIASSAGAGDH
jgi:hypothetical protein